MTAFLLAAFLMVHGLLHLAIWLPHPQPEQKQPFVPDHSLLLDTAVSTTTRHRLATTLAVGTCAVYLLAGLAAAGTFGWLVPAAVAAAALGLTLKVVYFHPWLSLGVLIDVLVLTVALAEWPWALT